MFVPVLPLFEEHHGNASTAERAAQAARAGASHSNAADMTTLYATVDSTGGLHSFICAKTASQAVKRPQSRQALSRWM